MKARPPKFCVIKGSHIFLGFLPCVHVRFLFSQPNMLPNNNEMKKFQNSLHLLLYNLLFCLAD